MTEFGVEAEGFELWVTMGSAIWMTSTGSGKRPRVATSLVESATTMKRRAALSTIFSRRRAPPPPLMRARDRGRLRRRRRWRGRARGSFVEVGDGDGERVGEFLAGGGGGDAADAQPLLDALAELVDEDGGGGAGAEAEGHAVLDELQGALGGLSLCFVLRHVSLSG